MSHIGVRILAAWFADATNGVANNLASLPVDGTDVVPSTVHIYNQLDQKWLARYVAGSPESLGTQLEYPAVLVTVVDESPQGGLPDDDATGRFLEGQVTLGCVCLVRDADSAKAGVSLLYLKRAVKGALLLLNEPSAESSRTRLGVQLQPFAAMQWGALGDAQDDSVLGGGWLVTYPTLETTPVTSP